MTSRFNTKLHQELRAAGADEAETGRLLAVAAGLGERVGDFAALALVV